MATFQSMRYAARVVRRGGVIAYPTEGVFGLGCLPDEVEVIVVGQEYVIDGVAVIATRAEVAP